MPPETSLASQALERGEAFMDADPPDYAAAANSFREALSEDGGCQRARWLLGDVLNELGDFDEAERQWEAAIFRDSKLSPPAISLGFRRLKQGRYEEAIDLLKRGVELQPHYAHADAKLFLAQAYEVAGRVDDAKHVWCEVLQMEPMYPSYDVPMKEAKKKLREYGVAG